MSNLKNWLDLPDTEKLRIFNEISIERGIPSAAVEKDWWVVHTLAAVFATEIAPYTVFKGGTSLSKAWGIIERFSEDIDLALDRSFFGLEGELSKAQVRKLRKKSFEYLTQRFFPELQDKFEAMGLRVTCEIEKVTDTDKDPIVIQVFYPTLFGESTYILPRILIEIGSRSLKEPFTKMQVVSLVGEIFNGRSFADLPIELPCVNPERTYLEKIFLLHEEFQKPQQKMRVERMSRHLYDVIRLKESEFGTKAFSDNLELYQTIVKHRRQMNALQGIDYDKHNPEFINPIPPPALIPEWKKDYEFMQEAMIFGASLSFEELIQELQILKQTINEMAKPI